MDKMREVLLRRGWKKLGERGIAEGWELPDAYICSITPGNVWWIERQWDPSASVIAAGAGEDDLDEALVDITPNEEVDLG